jgi:hypothetical protein
LERRSTGLLQVLSRSSRVNLSVAIIDGAGATTLCKIVHFGSTVVRFFFGLKTIFFFPFVRDRGLLFHGGDSNFCNDVEVYTGQLAFHPKVESVGTVCLLTGYYNGRNIRIE